MPLGSGGLPLLLSPFSRGPSLSRGPGVHAFLLSLVLSAVSPKCRTFWKAALFYWLDVWAPTAPPSSGPPAVRSLADWSPATPDSPTKGGSHQQDLSCWPLMSRASPSLSLFPHLPLVGSTFQTWPGRAKRQNAGVIFVPGDLSHEWYKSIGSGVLQVSGPRLYEI